MSQSRNTLLECVHSLGQLIEEKHAKYIAGDRAASSAATAAAAAQKESLAGTIVLRHDDGRRRGGVRS